MVITSQYAGQCKSCGAPHKPGDKVEWIKVQKGVRCLQCVAATMGPGFNPQAYQQAPPIHPPPVYPPSPQPYTAAYSRRWKQAIPYPSAPPPPYRPPPAPVVKPSLSTLALNALAALEALIIEANIAGTPSAESEAAWRKYQAAKAIALQPSTKGEERAALKQSVLLAVKLAF